MRKEKKIKINLSFDPSFFEILTRKAKKNYVSTSTYIRQFLMKSILENNTKYNEMKDEE